MRPNLQRRVQRYGWDKAAAHYEKFWQKPLIPAQKLLLEMADLLPGQRVLDVACGTGLITLQAARAVGGAGSIVGTDLSDEMVSVTSQAAKYHELPNVKTHRMGAEALDLEDASFDTALCGLGLMYVPDPLQALREMHRVLRPGGRCAVSVWGQRDRCGWAEIFPIVDQRVTSDVCPMFFQLGGEGMLARAFRKAGFNQLEEKRISTVIRYKTAEEACGAAFLGGPVALAYARFDEPTRSEAHAEYLESIAPYQNDEKYEIPGEFVVVHGVK